MLIHVFKIEADWAYAVYLKQLMNQKSTGKQKHARNPNRLRLHSLKRFKKVADSAEALLKMPDQGKLDRSSSYELEAYAL